MIKYVKGNHTYIFKVMELLNKIRKQFKEEKLDIYQGEDYPNREILLEDLRKKDSTILALNDTDEVVGYISSEKEEAFFKDCFSKYPKEYLEKYGLDIYKGRFIGFLRLMVDPDYQHQGIGSKLFELLEKRYDGYVIIFLVDKENKKAQKIYQKLNCKCLSLENFSFGDFYVYIKNRL